LYHLTQLLPSLPKKQEMQFLPIYGKRDKKYFENCSKNSSFFHLYRQKKVRSNILHLQSIYFWISTMHTLRTEKVYPNVSVTIVLMVMLMLARMLIFRTLVKRSTVHNNGDGDVVNVRNDVKRSRKCLVL
jgi:hypothetical protein